MAGVLPVVQQVFAELGPDVPVVIVAISDGVIGDKDKTVRAAQAAAMAVGARAAPVSVCLYRLMSSAAAEPDTRALTCIGAFNTAGKAPPRRRPHGRGLQGADRGDHPPEPRRAARH